MSWDSHVEPLVRDHPDLFESAAIWGKAPVSRWTSENPKLPLTEQDVKVLLGDCNAFASSGPTLMGTKFFMVSNALEDDKVRCMSLRSMNAPTPYYLVFGLTKTGILIAKVTATDVKPAINHVFKAVQYLIDSNC